MIKVISKCGIHSNYCKICTFPLFLSPTFLSNFVSPFSLGLFDLSLFLLLSSVIVPNFDRLLRSVLLRIANTRQSVGKGRCPSVFPFFGTDFVANSMLYHAFKQKYMDVVVGPESSPQLKDVLLTTCSSGFCIGEYLGSLGQQFPGRQVEIQFSAKKAPIMVFVEGRARFRLHGKMDLFVRPENATQRKELVLRSETTLTSNVNFWIERSQILGNATVENLDFKLVNTNVHDVDQSSFADLGLFGAEFLEKLLTEILQIGLVLPSMRGVVLRSPKLTIHDRYIRVQTYFKLDEHYAERLVQGAVRQTLLNIG